MFCGAGILVGFLNCWKMLFFLCERGLAFLFGLLQACLCLCRPRLVKIYFAAVVERSQHQRWSRPFCKRISRTLHVYSQTMLPPRSRGEHRSLGWEKSLRQKRCAPSRLRTHDASSIYMKTWPRRQRSRRGEPTALLTVGSAFRSRITVTT